MYILRLKFPLSQDYLKTEGNLSAEAVRMIGDMLNIDAIIALALTEMMFFNNNVNDNTK